MATYVCPECGAAFAADGSCNADGARLALARDPLLGQSVAGHRLARVVGEGGMGRVYLGVNPADRARVAVKILSEEYARDRSTVERFVSEARAIRLIHHENIVRVLDVSTLGDGRPCMVMEFLEGESLGALLRRGPLPLGTLSRLMVDVLRALGAAHERGIVHRDLKPDNLFVTREGRAKVLDFGVAKLLPEFGSLDGATRTGAVLGTPFYMAPEQALGRPVDPRSDVYSVGVILYECATGRRPFQGPTLYELMKQQIELDPAPPGSLRFDLPGAYDGVIRRAMAKQASQRFQTARELEQALEQVARELPPAAFAPPGSPLPAHVLAPESSYSTPGVPAYPPSYAAPSYLAPHAVLPHGVGSSRRGAPARGKQESSGSSVALFALAGCGFLIVLAIVGGALAFVLARTASAPVPLREDPARATEPPSAGDPEASKLEVAGADPPSSEPAFDTRRFDVLSFLPEAQKKAHGHYADAGLIAIDAQGVNPEGKVDFALQAGSLVLYRFRSPERSKPPADFPSNAVFESNCVVYVMVNRTGVSSYVIDRWACNTPIVRVPRCTFKDVFARAIKNGGPAGNVIGHIGFTGDIVTTPGGALRWYVNIPPSFSNLVEDDC